MILFNLGAHFIPFFGGAQNFPYHQNMYPWTRVINFFHKPHGQKFMDPPPFHPVANCGQFLDFGERKV